MRILYMMFLLMAITVCSINAQHIGWRWAKQSNTAGITESHGLATDKFGNSFIAGKFTGTATFGTTSVTSAGGEDGFLVKYDPTGNVLWVKSYENPGRAIARSVGVDSLGNSYVIGDYKDSIRIDGQLFFDFNSNPDQSGMFVIKYDPNGNQQWVKTAVSPRLGTYASGVTANKVAVSPGGTVFIIGDWTWYFKIEGLTKIATFTVPTEPFIACYSNNGLFKWAEFPTSTNNATVGQGIAVDANDNCYLTGETYGISIGQASVSNTQGNFYIAKLNKFGIAEWAIGSGSGARTRSNSITVDNAGKIYVSGWFETPTTIAGTSFTPGGFSDAFVASFDSSGAPLWAKSIAGAQRETVTALKAAQGGVFATGYFEGTATFNPSTIRTAAGGRDAFVAHYAANGDLNFAEAIGGPGNGDYAYNLSVFNNDILVTGKFSGSIPFGSTTLLGGGEAFLARSSSIVMGTDKKELTKQIKFYPNPTDNLLRISSGTPLKDAQLTLHSITGQLIKQQNLAAEGETVLSLQALPAGLYYLTIRSDGKQMVTKIVKH